MRVKKSANKDIEEQSALNSNINKGTTFKGEIESNGNLRVDGTVEGQINCKTKLVLGSDCNIIGNIVAQNAEIAGKVDGNIEATEIVTLKASAKINGDITTAQLIIEPGANFNGKSNMTVSKTTSDVFKG